MNFRYTEQDVNVISNHVKMHPDNLSAAFEDAARELNRPATGVTQYYYKNMKNNPGTKVILLATSKGMVVNTKNSPRRQEVEESLVLETVRFAISKLTRAEKAQLIKRMLES